MPDIGLFLYWRAEFKHYIVEQFLNLAVYL
jgi:hypothetical protein